MLHPLCAGAGRRHLLHGSYDRHLHHRSGCYLVHYRCLRSVSGHRGHSPGEHGEHHRECGLLRVHPPVGSHSAGKSVHLGYVPDPDSHGLQPVLQAVYRHSHCAHPALCFCGTALQQYRRCFHQKLCRHLSGGLCHRIGLCDLLRLLGKSPGAGRQFPVRRHAGLELSLSAATLVWNYIGETIFNMLVLVGCVKLSDRLIRELMGLG